MAIKVFCDGCDEELSENSNTRLDVSVGTHINKTFDLCSGCASRLIREAFPNNWVRAARKAR